ncbi:MAG: glycosyltransferase family 2 protein [Steroidobacteraceae bacterium]|jgi:glycosyltransferase involved in cell wall biosynthesis|nr:glycosyltransferase family 2 protein [Steroidobacteraceae bacterium]
MRVSLIVTTYNWPVALDLVLASVARQSRLPDEVLVADDGSRDDTRAVVDGWMPRLGTPLLHVWQADLGYRLARSRNGALALARGDYVIVVDGDMLLHRDFVADHVAFARPGCFAQGPRVTTTEPLAQRLLASRALDVTPFTPGLRRARRALRWLPLARAWNRDRTGSLDGIHGCNQAFWRDDLVRVNGWNEAFEGWGPEDREAVARLYHAGVRRRNIRFAALAVHLWHRTRKQDGPNPYAALLAQTLATRAVRCEHGLDAHLDTAATPAVAGPAGANRTAGTA